LGREEGEEDDEYEEQSEDEEPVRGHRQELMLMMPSFLSPKRIRKAERRRQFFCEHCLGFEDPCCKKFRW